MVLHYDDQFSSCFEVDFRLSLGRVLCHVYGQFVVSIGASLSPVERVFSEMSLGQKTACTGGPKVPRACNFIGASNMTVNILLRAINN